MWLWIIGGVIIAVGFVAFTGAPYLPSKRRDIRVAFTELYCLSEADTLVDIGSGDGVVLRAARECGARAIGYEIHPLLVVVSRWLSRRDSGVEVHLANFWRAKLPEATTVVYTFGDGRDIKKMYTKIQQEASRLKKEISFISYGFAVPDESAIRSVGAYHLYDIKPLQSANHKYNKSI